MKPFQLQFTQIHLPACLTALVILTNQYAIAKPIVGEIINSNLTVTGWGCFTNGVDLGLNGDLLLNWLPANASNPLGTATSDIALAQGSFLWRDSITPAPAARNKMRLDSSNNLSLFRSDGTEGVVLDPQNGRIRIPAAGTSGGIFFGTNTVPTLQAAANGAAIFPAQLTLKSGLLLSNGTLQVSAITPATSSNTGALIVAGGIGSAMDAYINGVRVGRGAGNNSANTVAGVGSLGVNTTGYNNTGVGAYALHSNTIGYYNTAFGPYALYSNTMGAGNTALGHNAGYFNTLGNNNVILGSFAAYYQANGTTLTNTQNSIYIGTNSKGKDNSDSNSIVIGTKAIGEGANTTVIGNMATTKTHLYGELVASSATIGGYPVLATQSGTNSSLTNLAMLAIGASAKATQENAIAIGRCSQASMPFALALGDTSYATGPHSTAMQQGFAAGEYSFAANQGDAEGGFSLAITYGKAYGYASVAIGGFDGDWEHSNYAMGAGSVALGGRMNMATGPNSYALGNRVTASSACSFCVGSQNLSASHAISPVGDMGWIEESALLEVGNGNPDATKFDTSNAITTLKNGQTTLTNKAWKANITAPLADPIPTTDSGGNALVVEGHTVLKGKVVIEQAQGDISMGIYADNGSEPIY